MKPNNLQSPFLRSFVFGLLVNILNLSYTCILSALTIKLGSFDCTDKASSVFPEAVGPPINIARGNKILFDFKN